MLFYVIDPSTLIRQGFYEKENGVSAYKTPGKPLWGFILFSMPENRIVSEAANKVVANKVGMENHNETDTDFGSQTRTGRT